VDGVESKGYYDITATKKMSNDKISFSTSTWLTLISLITTGVATNLILIYTMAGNLQTRIDNLDDKWQERLLVVTAEIKQDIRSVESKIPPDWFRQMVESNQRKIDELESEFTRDFVRKSELPELIKD
jgi:hypothetical protein